MDLALSYEDVLLIPKYSDIISRKDLNTKTRLTNKIFLNIPLISSNMDTVTESDMAIAMAEHGGIGIIHRFNTIEQQVNEIKKVKRYRSAVIENPICISPDARFGEALELIRETGIASFLVVQKNKLVGIFTTRDYRFFPSEDKKIKDMMTPKTKLIVASSSISVEKAKSIMLKHKIEKLPLINNDWSVAGLITAKDIHKKTKWPNSTLDENFRLRVGAAIGVKEEAIKRADALVNAGADVLVIDIAHGHSKLEIETLKSLRVKFPEVQLIAGNVATAEGTSDLIKAGADCIKVGVGPGSICTTRIVTGAGYPQLSAVMNCAKEADKFNIPIIADGGIKQSGEITKAISAGACSVMLGSMLAGTDESPGSPLLKNGKRVKVIRGMASFGAKLGRDAKEKKELDVSDFVPEGVEATVPYKGAVSEIINQLVGGLRSGMSYCGARNLDELRGKCNFVRITSSGLRESNSHDVNLA